MKGPEQHVPSGWRRETSSGRWEKGETRGLKCCEESPGMTAWVWAVFLREASLPSWFFSFLFLISYYLFLISCFFFLSSREASWLSLCPLCLCGASGFLIGVAADR